MVAQGGGLGRRLGRTAMAAAGDLLYLLSWGLFALSVYRAPDLGPWWGAVSLVLLAWAAVEAGFYWWGRWR